MELEPLFVKTATAKRLLDVGNTKFWQLVKEGKIKLVEIGDGHRQVDYKSLKSLAAGE
jgi:hypothetical protein